MRATGNPGPLRAWGKNDFPGCDLAEDLVIEAEEIVIGRGVRVGPGVQISAREVRIGSGTHIEHSTVVRGLGGTMASFVIGDESFIGHSTQILAPEFRMGDYCQLHNSGLHSGYKPLKIGHNCWVGQSSILNCTERLTIGNNVRIGTQSQLWTHVASGELLEGCTLYGETPLVLEDNVWVVGGAVLSPGLTVRRNSIIMTGSVLTKSTEPFHTYAGVPARDVTEKLSFWKPQSLDEKIERLHAFLGEFVRDFPQHRNSIKVLDWDELADSSTPGDLIFVTRVMNWACAEDLEVSLFDLTTKTYSKRRTAIEIDWMKWSVGYRARFVPNVS